MIDLRLVRENPDAVRASQRARGADESLVDALLAADAARREAVTRADDLRAEQKTASQAVRGASPEERPGRPGAGQGARRRRSRRPRRPQRAADAALRAAHLPIPNVVADGVPPGGEDDAVLMRTVGEVPAYDFPVRDHLEIGEALGAIDMERGAKVSGARFYFLTGPGALLEFALAQLAISRAVAAGFTPVIAPALVRPEAMEGTGFLGEHDEEVYRIERDDLYLVGTSEVALAGMHSGEVLDLSAGPRRYAGWSSCFRREAGSYGKDTRGIIRVHWFDKVEMFSFCPPEEAAAEHLRLLAVGGGVPAGAGAALPRRRHRRRRPRHQRHPQVRHRGVVPHPGHLPRADVDVGLHDLPGAPAQHPVPRRRRQAADRRHPQRHPVRDRPHHRLPARGAPARRRLGARAQGAAAVAGRASSCSPRG